MERDSLVKIFLGIAVAILIPLGVQAFTSNLFSTTLTKASSQFWSITDVAQSGLDATTTMSVSAWLYPTSTPSSGQVYTILSKFKAGSVSDRSYSVTYYNNGGTPELDFGASDDGINADAAIFPLTLPLNTWTSIRMVYSGASVHLYTDNTDRGSAPINRTTIHDSAAPFFIGALSNASTGSQDYFDGFIDEVLFYNTNISAATASSTYSNPCNPPLTNLVSEWRFENNGNDSVGINNLTNNNSAGFSSSVPFVCAVAGTGTSTTQLMWFDQ